MQRTLATLRSSALWNVFKSHKRLQKNRTEKKVLFHCLIVFVPNLEIYSQSTTSTSSVVTPTSNATQSTLTAPNPTNGTTASDGALKSTASLFVILFSLLHLYC
ncbi:signal transducer CD24 [Talpa occidentalis]|uniref:signal transducer CD24 n=1 Tax=Talpa occidentalis TaxID=50954 RepID=UPI0023F63E70|nr:signal transducer CD24 [Talpa occidentalis]